MIFAAPKIKSVLLAALVLFALPVFIFFNLHFNHEYYQASSLVFLIVALALASLYGPPQALRAYPIAPLIVIFLVASNLHHFTKIYGTSVRTPAVFFWRDPSSLLGVADVVRRYSPERSGIVVFGTDWNSTIAYYSRRKSFTVPSWPNADWDKQYNSVWKDPKAYLGGNPIGALVFCEKGDRPNLRQIMERPEAKGTQKFFKVGSCYIWLPYAPSDVLTFDNQLLTPVTFFEDVVQAVPAGLAVGAPAHCEGSIDVVGGLAADRMTAASHVPDG